jgi:hypothetical protein
MLYASYAARSTSTPPGQISEKQPINERSANPGLLRFTAVGSTRQRRPVLGRLWFLVVRSVNILQISHPISPLSTLEQPNVATAMIRQLHPDNTKDEKEGGLDTLNSRLLTCFQPALVAALDQERLRIVVSSDSRDQDVVGSARLAEVWQQGTVSHSAQGGPSQVLGTSARRWRLHSRGERSATKFEPRPCLKKRRAAGALTSGLICRTGVLFIRIYMFAE